MFLRVPRRWEEPRRALRESVDMLLERNGSILPEPRGPGPALLRLPEGDKAVLQVHILEMHRDHILPSHPRRHREGEQSLVLDVPDLTQKEGGLGFRQRDGPGLPDALVLTTRGFEGHSDLCCSRERDCQD